MTRADAPPTEERSEWETLFVAHLPFIERVTGTVASVLGLRGPDAEEFAAWATSRLWEGDYAVLRKWRGESRLTTYLTAVVTNLGRDFRVLRWGRWRASAAAVRLGAVAVRLEALVYRDGASLPEAGTLLRASGATALTDRELARLLDQLPPRARPRRVDADGDTGLPALPSDARTDAALLAEEEAAARRAAYAALGAALERLPAEERTVVRMHYLQGHTLADVARALGVPQKPLYRLRERALATLRQLLTAAGVTPAEVRELIGGALAEVPLGDATTAGNVDDVHPSHSTRPSPAAGRRELPATPTHAEPTGP